MSEKPFSGGEKTAVSTIEAVKKEVKVTKLAEGVSTGWEGERTFTEEEVIFAVKEIVLGAGEIQVTDKTVNHEGVLIALFVRAPGSDVSYSFVLKGDHGRNSRTRTVIDRIDYASPDSEEIVYSEEIAEEKNGVWVKS